MLRSLATRAGILLAAAGLAASARTARSDTTFTFAGHTYQVVTAPKTWANAAADAVGRAMYGLSGALVRIDGQAENDAIITQLLAAIPSSEFGQTDAPDGGGGAYVWLGATDRVTENTWLWDGDNDGVGDPFWQGRVDGSPVGGLYNNWGREPDDYNGQDAAGICLNRWPLSSGSLGGTGQWNDVDEYNNLYYLIEFDAVPEPTVFSLLCFGGLAGVALSLRARFARRGRFGRAAAMRAI